VAYFQGDIEIKMKYIDGLEPFYRSGRHTSNISTNLQEPSLLDSIYVYLQHDRHSKGRIHHLSHRTPTTILR
jgi:hypothetical protein